MVGARVTFETVNSTDASGSSVDHKLPQLSCVDSLSEVIILEIVGRSADSVLILLLLFQCLLGFRLFHTIWLHLRNRRAGMARERELLALPLPPDAELPAVLIQIPTFNEGALV